MDTCRNYNHGFSTHYADQAVTTAIETYTTLATIDESNSPSIVLYKAHDLDFDEIEVDDLCTDFINKNAQIALQISDFTLYCGDSTLYECAAPQFTLEDNTC